MATAWGAPQAPGAMRVVGLKELTRDFRRMSKTLGEGVRQELIEIGRPVAETGKAMALDNIRNMPYAPYWAEMKPGFSRAYATLYIVPAIRSRRRKGQKRPNFADLWLERAAWPAVEAHEEELMMKLEGFIDHMADSFGF